MLKAKLNILLMALFETVVLSQFLTLYYAQSISESSLPWQARMSVTVLMAFALSIILIIGFCGIFWHIRQIKRGKEEKEAERLINAASINEKSFEAIQDKKYSFAKMFPKNKSEV